MRVASERSRWERAWRAVRVELSRGEKVPAAVWRDPMSDVAYRVVRSRIPRLGCAGPATRHPTEVAAAAAWSIEARRTGSPHALAMRNRWAAMARSR